MAVVKTDRKLRTVDDLVSAGEWMFSQQEGKNLDAKSADAMNTTLKGQRYLVVELPLQLMKLYVTAQVKKFTIPRGILPAGIAFETEAK